MKKLVFDIINKLQIPKVQFADVRLTSTDHQNIFFRNGALLDFSNSVDEIVIGIRVLVNGCWGFCGTSDISKSSVERTIKKAITNAEHGSAFRANKVKFDPIKPFTGSYFYKPEIDPFLMADDEKISYVQTIANKLMGHDKIVNTRISTEFYRQYKIYANTEGTFTDTLVYDVNPQMQVLASDGMQALSRTFPGDMCAKRGGFEVVKNYKMEENVENIIKEAVDLLNAPTITEEKADLIIGSGHLALQLHESVGHATEADRIYGMEISYAGKTFVKPEMLGKFKYGSEIVNIYSDSTDPRGLGFHLCDDEGVPARTVDIVKNGILVDQQTSREIAPQLGVEPSSNMLASYADDFPLIRMTNFCLAPGKGSLAELIKNTENGYLVDFTKCWSIDDNRNNFQFTTEIGWKIKDGEIKHIVKEPTYFGITPEFWASCDAVCGEEEWQYWGTFHCGKGEPGQAMHLSHGVAPARFKDVVCNVKA
jgi:TldD protein